MQSPDTTGSEHPRARAARTKRDRTRRALLDAADSVFGSRGWAEARMEDVAIAAGVSVATAYNHFPSKHALVGHVFRPLVGQLDAPARQDILDGRAVEESVKDQVRQLVRISKRNRVLTSAFWTAAEEHALRVGRHADPEDENDPRALAPVAGPLALLLRHGQESGALRPYPVAEEVAALIVDMLLARAFYYPEETPQDLAELLLTVVFGLVKPELLVTTDGAGRPFRSAY